MGRQDVQRRRRGSRGSPESKDFQREETDWALYPAQNELSIPQSNFMGLTQLSHLDFDPYTHLDPQYSMISNLNLTLNVNHFGLLQLTVLEGAVRGNYLDMEGESQEHGDEDMTEEQAKGISKETLISFSSNSEKQKKGIDDHMKLIKEMKINPDIMLKRKKLLVGEPSSRGGHSLKGDALTHLVVNPQQRCKSRFATLSPNNYINDVDIHNCNRLFWMRNNLNEASKLWSIGKDIGFTQTRNEDDIIKRIEDMEGRDNAKSGEKVEGNNHKDLRGL